MAMVVRSNIMAMNANRSLGINNSQVSKNLEKLSSGFRINRAGDDASGLAISEKMKAQVKGLETASSNSQDGISLVQTAEGALTEVHDMLNRMTELATKSANGTIQDEVDRDAIQSEVDALNEEINRISKSTNFNGINLLDGSLSTKGGSSAVTSIKTSLSTSDVDATKGSYSATAPTSLGADKDKVSFSVGLDNGKSFTVELTIQKDTSGNGGKFVDANGKEYGTIADISGLKKATAAETGSALAAALKDTALGKDFAIETALGGAIKLTAKEAGTGAATVTSFGESLTTAAGVTTTATQKVTAVSAKDAKIEILSATPTKFDGTNADSAIFTINGKKFALLGTGGTADKLDKDVTALDGTGLNNLHSAANMAIIAQKTGLTVEANAGGNGILLSAGTGSNAKGGLTLQIGDTGDDFNMVKVSVADMSAKGLGTAGLDVSNADSARASIATIKAAINTVSTNRADLGALQNRLEHTINNLDVAAENMSAANSRIRDTDMAKQMMEYTKTNVLTQAAQAMLAQANQQPQSVLQLLQ